MSEEKKLVKKYTLSQLSDMAHQNLGHLKWIIQSGGVSVPLDGRPNVDLIDLACALQDGSKLPDWARTDKGAQSGSVMTFDQMIAACNNDWEDEDIIEKNFPVDPSRFTTEGTKVFYFGTETSTAGTLATFIRDSHEPAGLESLLAYGAENPEEQRKHPIVALGASWMNPNGNRGVPCLCGCGGDERRLYLRWVPSGCCWGGICRFLAVRKSSS